MVEQDFDLRRPLFNNFQDMNRNKLLRHGPRYFTARTSQQKRIAGIGFGDQDQ